MTTAVETPSFFDHPASANLLLVQAGAWLGTPFRARSAVRGAGVDCVRLAGEIMRDCGVVAGYDFGPYALDRAKHSDQSLVLDWLRGSGRFALLPAETTTPRTGDLALFKIGRCVHHLGVLLDGKRFLHALEGVGVVVSQLDDSTWSRRLAGFARPLPL